MAKPAAAAPVVAAPVAAAPAAAAPVAASATDAHPFALLTALRADGSEAGSHPVTSTAYIVGRDIGSIFAGDSYLSPRHATFSLRAGKLFVKDEGSLNGVYRRLRRDEPTPLRNGDVFRIGQEILRYESLQPLPATSDGVERLGSPAKGYVGRIALIIGRESSGNAFPSPRPASTWAASAATCSSPRTATSRACTAASRSRTGTRSSRISGAPTGASCE